MNRRLLDVARLKSETFRLQIKRRHEEAFKPKQEAQQENQNGTQQSDNEQGQPDNTPPANIPAG